MDVLVSATPANAERVLRGLLDFGAPIDQHAVTEGLFATPGGGYRMGIKPNLIEVLTQVSGITFADALTDHLVAHVDGRSVPVIGRAALLANKRAAGRAKDLADVEWLEAHQAEI